MFDLSVPWWELILRALAVYLFLLLILRLTGKRQVGQLAPFDLVLLLVLSNAVQNSMNGGDNSLAGGLISAATLIVLNYGIGAATFHSRGLEKFIEGQPQILIHDGKLNHAVMKSAQLTTAELEGALRLAGCDGIQDCMTAVLEINGAISVGHKLPARAALDMTD